MNRDENISKRFVMYPLFNDLTAEEKQDMLTHSSVISFAKGEIIFDQEESGNTIYFIDSGQVVLSRLDPAGKDLTLAILEPGDFFGEMAVMDSSGRSAKATAYTDITVSSITSQNFHDLLLKHPNLSLKIISTLCLRLRTMDQRLEGVAYSRVKERLKNLLSDSESQEKILILSATHQELAAKIGASRETVTRILKELREEGWKIQKDR